MRVLLTCIRISVMDEPFSIFIITSLAMFSSGFVCEFVCEQDNSKTWTDFDEIFRICLKR